MCVCVLLDFLPQSSLQQHVHSLQEESAQLKVALEKAPSETQTAKFKRRIGKLKGSMLEVHVVNVEYVMLP